MFKVVEIQLEFETKKSIKKEELLFEFGKYIDKVFSQTKEGMLYHHTIPQKGNRNKLYCFSVKKPSIYQYEKGKTYTMLFRTADLQVLNLISYGNILSATSESFSIESVSFRSIKKEPLERMRALSPVVWVRADQKYWRYADNVSIMDYKKALEENLKNKYFGLTGKMLDDVLLIKQLQLTKKKPATLTIAHDNEKFRRLGDYFDIYFHDNPIAQDVAYMTIGTGLFHNCTRGAGFMYYIKKGDKPYVKRR